MVILKSKSQFRCGAFSYCALLLIWCSSILCLIESVPCPHSQQVGDGKKEKNEGNPLITIGDSEYRVHKMKKKLKKDHDKYLPRTP